MNETVDLYSTVLAQGRSGKNDRKTVIKYINK